MKAYKYRHIDDLDKFHIPSLTNNQIYAPLYSELNDPFEGLFEDKISEIVKSLEIIFKADGTEVHKNLKAVLDYKVKLGIFSLSKTYYEELLWAHYASSHKGFCIEYDIEKLKDKYLAPISVHQFEVEYRKSPQPILTNDIGKDKLLVKLFATKSLKWKYEEEVRLMFDNGGSYKSYHPAAVTGIYFGKSMTEEKKIILIDLLANRDIKFYEMQMEKNSYGLRRRLVHENFRSFSKNDPNSYEVLTTNHYSANQNFDVLYKGTKFDENSIKTFINKFIDEHATKDCNVFLFKIIGKQNIEFASYDTKTPGYLYWNDLNAAN